MRLAWIKVRSVKARWTLSTAMIRAKVCINASVRKTAARRTLTNANHHAAQVTKVASRLITANIWRDVSMCVLPPNVES